MRETAYEVRICDWSSDVCSSDLARLDDAAPSGQSRRCRARGHRSRGADGVRERPVRDLDGWLRNTARSAARRARRRGTEKRRPHRVARRRGAGRRYRDRPAATAGAGVARGAVRSEEHTSELQSLMRKSYAVFCLKKTNINMSYKDKTDNQRREET